MQRGIDVGTAHRFDEGADDVVVLVAVTVVAHRGFVHRPLDGLHADQLAGRLGCLGRYFQRGQGAPGVAGRELHQQVDGLRRYRDCPAQAAGVIDRALYYRAGVLGRQRPQLQDQRPRQQRCHHRKRRVLGGRRHQQHHPVFHRRQQGVLLGLGKSVHLVDEQHGLLAVKQRFSRILDDRPHFLDAGRQCRQGLEPAAGGLRDQRRQRCLAAARGP